MTEGDADTTERPKRPILAMDYSEQAELYLDEMRGAVPDKYRALFDDPEFRSAMIEYLSDSLWARDTIVKAYSGAFVRAGQNDPLMSLISGIVGRAAATIERNLDHATRNSDGPYTD